jgi:ABC-type sugar transport system substrate-binding protein
MSRTGRRGRSVIRALVLPVALLAPVIAGCGSGSSASTAGSASGASTGQSAGGKTAFLLGCTNENPWCNGFNKSLVDGLTRAGVKVTELTTNFDPVVQAQEAAQAISQHPAAILSHVADPTSAASWMRRAKAAGIKVIAVDADIGPVARALVTANLMPDHCALGRFAATNIQEGLAKQGKTTGNVILVTGTQSQIHVQTRLTCFKEQLAKTPGLKTVEIQDGNWDPIKTATITQQLLAKWRDKGGIQGAYGMADYQAAAISRVAKQMGLPLYPESKPGMVVTGSNCATSGMQAIQNGTMYGGATQSPVLEGQDFVPYVQKVLDGQTIGNKITTPVNRITKADVAKYTQYCTYGG